MLKYICQLAVFSQRRLLLRTNLQVIFSFATENQSKSHQMPPKRAATAAGKAALPPSEAAEPQTKRTLRARIAPAETVEPVKTKKKAAKKVEPEKENSEEPKKKVDRRKKVVKDVVEAEEVKEDVKVEVKEKKRAAKPKENAGEIVEEVKTDVKEVASKAPAAAPKSKAARKQLPDKVEEAVEANEEQDEPEAPKKPKLLLNQTSTDWSTINFACSKPNNLKVTSWNVDGIKAWLKKGGLSILEYDNPDILCLQEVKCDSSKLPEELSNLEKYQQFWCTSEKKSGYAGVAIFTKTAPLSVTNGLGVDDIDEEGRCITAEYESFYLVNVYVPNSGRGLVTLGKRLEWNKVFKSYINKLNEKKPVIVCGDLNVAHEEIDLANPKTNKKSAGFTQEERDGFTEFLGEGYIDTFRQLYPEKEKAYTFWTYMSKSRAKNVGWRLDYFVVSQLLKDKVCDQVFLDQVYGSDHCPITLYMLI